MNKLVTLCALLSAPFTCTAQQPKPTQIVIDYCVNILHQTPNEATTCYSAPEDYNAENCPNDAVLIYLCCLGCFGGVTNDYLPYLENDFLEYICQMTTDKEVLIIAKFVIACKVETRKLSAAHFLFWRDNGQTNSACPPA
ncbi:hypothetical protein BsWGS_10694 [Bradybaena similaris]